MGLESIESIEGQATNLIGGYNFYKLFKALNIIQVSYLYEGRGSRHK